MSGVVAAGTGLPPAAPLDPQIQTLVDNLPNGISLPVGTDPVKARAQFERITVALRDQQGPADLAGIENIKVPGAAGELDARIYIPFGEGDTPTILFFHGGGFIVGSIESHDLQVRSIAERTGATVVSAEYRLAPENPFPAAADDAESIARFVVANIDRFGGDASRVIVAGDSAGGNLAAVCAQNVPGVTGQLLIYPVVDFATVTPAMTEHAEGPLLTAKAASVFHEAYAGSADHTDPRLSPIFAEDLSGLPPAVVVTCEYDILRDGGAAYAEKLRDASVPVTQLHYPSLMHGFMGFFPLSSGCDAALAELCEAATTLY